MIGHTFVIQRNQLIFRAISNLNLPKIHNEIEDLVEEILIKKRETILIMSNGSFDNIHEKLINKLKNLNNVND